MPDDSSSSERPTAEPSPAGDTEASPVEDGRGCLARARAIWRASDKTEDFLWARWATRPYAALILAALHRVRMTPNAISLVSLAVGLASCAAYAFWPGVVGLWAGWLLGQAAYTVDCMDGMLARSKRLYSPAGTALDFLADAIKQICLFPAVGYRLWVEAGRPIDLVGGWPLWVALLSGPIVASALAMTVFLRSPEVTGEDERAHRDARDTSVRGRVMALIGFLLNYPSWVLVPVIFDRMDVFLIISVPLYAAYAAWALLLIVRRVCGFDHYERSRGERRT